LQFGLQLNATDGEGVHGGIEKLRAVAAQRFCAPHGSFRVVEEVIRTIESGVAESDPDAHGGGAGECPLM
jgi:hypothetical protein